jgi:hypothetical protein
MPGIRSQKSGSIAPATGYAKHAAGAETYAQTSQSVYIEAAGNVAFILMDGSTGDTILSVPAGTILPIQANGTAAATTATTVPLYE